MAVEIICMITTIFRYRPRFFMSTLFYVFIILPIFFSFIDALSFSFESFTPGDTHISYEGGASVDPKNLTIELVPDVISIGSVGRATYFEPFQLWDEGSGNLSDFMTHFSFVIDSRGSKIYADGLAFFLAPAGSKLSMNTRGGGSMGLTWDDESVNNTHGDPFVAVEFDIYCNFWDPPYDHVGIDVNSMESMNTTRWWSNVQEGSRNEAWISYNSSSKQLSVVFSGWNYSRVSPYKLSTEVDFKAVLTPRVTFGFSASTGSNRAIYSIHSWEFNSTSPLITGKKRKGSIERVIMGLGICGGIVLLGGFALAYLISKDVALDRHLDVEFENGTGPRKYSYREIKRAANNFNDEAKLGEGGYGSVYKGFLRELKSDIAVKMLFKESEQGIKEFASEIKVISQLRHRNLVRLVGWCHKKRKWFFAKKRKLLLLYEYMPNGSLDRHLYKRTELLVWEIRYKVAQDLASALLYLHEGWEHCVVHRDIKSSNIMLDSGFNAKLGDFGLARFVDHAKGSKTTKLIGTKGYMALEYVVTKKATKESDVYSFGIVVLEIACGRKPIDEEKPEGQIVMVDWVWELYDEGKVLEAADPRLNPGDYDERQMEKLIIVGLWCAHPDCSVRPSTKQVNFVLNGEAPLPPLPPRRPIDPCTTNSTTSSFGYCTATSDGINPT